jgi:threonine dehydrogenase-like Zn-dependent dehydrogenase
MRATFYSRVGVPQYDEGDIGWHLFGRNRTLTGGPAPARNYIEELMPDILDGSSEPGRVFDRTVRLAKIPDGYRAMDERQALKVLVQP